MSRKLARLPFDLPTARVRRYDLQPPFVSRNTNRCTDANLFKEAFIKAQQENEALLKEDGDDDAGESQKTEKMDETKAE